MADDWKKRPTMLEEGETYRVLRAAPPFKAGERVCFRQAGYSRYDDAHVYELDAEDGIVKTFWLSDSDPIERLTGTFER